jgi:Tfp pilus assembly protein PilP
MSRARRVLLSLLLVAGLVVGGALSQDEDVTPAPEADIESIFEAEEQMFAGGGYSYEPGERRDPFKSLLSAREPAELRGPRPEGIPGLLIDEIDLTGIFVTPEGPVAQVVSPEQDRSYLLREGDQLYDGDVVRISQDSVVFKQILDDPTALKPFREVQKQLNP